MYFKIGNTDMSAHTIDNDYNINSQEVTKEWKDGLGVKHENVIRTKISGSLGLWFAADNGTDVDSFLTLLNNSKVNGLLPVTLYVKNTHGNVTTSVYYKLTGSDHVKTVGNIEFNRFTMTIEEP